MKPSSSNSRSKGHAKARRKTREELDQEARDRKRQKKRRGHAPGSRAAGGNTTSGSKGQNAPKDPRIGSKTPIPLGVTEKVTKQHKPKSEKPMLSPQAELELLETDERLDALLERLEAGVLELFESDRYKNYLSVMSKFHQYSINNSVLIAMQRPDATRVSGYNNWKDKFHRQVRRGEKGIRIIQPAPYQAKRMVEKADPHTGETITGANGQPVMEDRNHRLWMLLNRWFIS